MTNSPDEVCYLVVRRPGETEDAADPRQVVFQKEPEEPLPQDTRSVGPVAKCPPLPLPYKDGGAQTQEDGVHPNGDHDGDHSQVITLLQLNAEEFQYTVGRHEGALTVATIAEPLTFNLVVAKDASSSGVLGYVFEELTEIPWPSDEAGPLLAESWARSEDGLTWTFNLRTDVRWRDGEPFTAADVAFTFNRIIYNTDIDAGSVWRAVEMTVTALDDHTVEFVLAKPSPTFLRNMGTSILPKHILESHVYDGTFAKVWDIDADPTEVIGTGPFTIASYEPGEHLVLARNPDYWLTDADGNRLPYLDEIVRIIVANEDVELAKFRAGETDVYGLLGEEVEILSGFQQVENFTILELGPDFGEEFLAFNMNPGFNPEDGSPYVANERLAWFRTKAFRQAVAHVVDKETIVDEVHHGHGFSQ